ncbi:hypothetical protein NL676_028967 [Syzygium grande]|nr:hypothetical protein NL676_028967 [Syzygium grande]
MANDKIPSDLAPPASAGVVTHHDKIPFDVAPPASAGVVAHPSGGSVPFQALGGPPTTDALLENLTSKLTQILTTH